MFLFPTFAKLNEKINKSLQSRKTPENMLRVNRWILVSIRKHRWHCTFVPSDWKIFNRVDVLFFPIQNRCYIITSESLWIKIFFEHDSKYVSECKGFNRKELSKTVVWRVSNISILWLHGNKESFFIRIL